MRTHSVATDASPLSLESSCTKFEYKSKHSLLPVLGNEAFMYTAMHLVYPRINIRVFLGVL